ALLGKLREAGMEHVADLERRCLLSVLWMGDHGVPFDRQGWEALAGQAGAEAAELALRLDGLAPQRPGTFPGLSHWNWDSNPQVAEVLGLLGFRVANVDDNTLAGIAHPLAEALRHYRSARKRSSTYGREWVTKHVAADGRVYTDWKQCGAITGRMASGDPNLQNVPTGAAYRRCFAAPEGRVLVKADYSQIELRIAARAAGEQKMIDAYLRGDDLHTLTAR